MGGTTTAALVARFGAADGGGRPADRESLRELALREPQGPLDVPVDLAVRGWSLTGKRWWCLAVIRQPVNVRDVPPHSTG